MLRKTGLLLFIGLQILWSCTETTSVGKTKMIQHSGILEEQMYDEDAVYDYVFDNQEFDYDSLKKKSRKYFLEGVDEFKNKKHYTKAISAFKRSILQFPDAVTYYELGNALLAINNYRDAVKAYNVALKLEIEATGTLYYNLAIATYYEQGNPYDAIDYFEKAIEHGYSDWEFINADKRIEPLRQEKKYQELYEHSQLAKDPNAVDTFRFHLFKKNFNYKSSLAMSAEDITFFNSEQYISYDYEEYVKEMRSASFGREVSEEFFYVAKLEENEKYVVLLYASVDMMSEQFAPTRFIMTTFSRTGEELDKREVGYSNEIDHMRTFKWEDGKVYVEDLDRKWKFDMSTKKAIDNEMIDVTSVKLTEYVITSEGRFSEVNTTASTKE